MHRNRGLAPNRGSGRRERRRPASPELVCALSGPLRFVDGGGKWAALAVRDASSVARRLVGSTITLDLSSARLAVDDRNRDGMISVRDLLPGDDVRITARLPRSTGSPDGVLRVRRLSATGPVAAT